MRIGLIPAEGMSLIILESPGGAVLEGASGIDHNYSARYRKSMPDHVTCSIVIEHR